MHYLGISLIDIYHMLASFVSNVFQGDRRIHLGTCLFLGKLADDKIHLRTRLYRSSHCSSINDIYFLSTLLHFCRVSFAMYGSIGTKYNLGYRRNYIPVYNDRTRLRLIGWRLLQSAVCITSTAKKVISKHNRTTVPPVEYWPEHELNEEALVDVLSSTLDCAQRFPGELNIDDRQRILDIEEKCLKAKRQRRHARHDQADSERIIHAIEDSTMRDHEFVGSQGRAGGVRYDPCSGTKQEEVIAEFSVLPEYLPGCTQNWPLSITRLYWAFHVDSINTVECRQASEYLLECDNDLYAFVTEMGITTNQVLLFHVTNHAFEVQYCLYIDPYRREVVVAVRGTMSLGDIKVDLTVGYTRVTRPPPAYDELIGSCLNPASSGQATVPVHRAMSMPSSNRKIPRKLRDKLFKDHLVDYTDKSMEKGMYAHQGIYLASSSLFYTIKPYIEQLFSILKDRHSFAAYFRNEYALCDTANWPYTFVFTGHSLGAAVAALLGYFFQPLLGNRLRVYGFGAPPTVSLLLSKELEVYSYQISLERDVVCRLSLGAIQTTLWRASLREEIEKRGLVDRLLSILESADGSASPECNKDADTSSLQVPHDISDDALLRLYISRASRTVSEETLTLYTPGRLLILELLRAQDASACPQSLADITNLCIRKGSFDLRGQCFAQLCRGSHASIGELVIAKDMWTQHLMYYEYLLLVYYSLLPLPRLPAI